LLDLRNPLFVRHIVHVLRGIALKLLHAVNGAEIERFTVKVMTGSSIGNADFHFADWIDRHGAPPSFSRLIQMAKGRISLKIKFGFQQLAISNWQLAQLKPGRHRSETPNR
jgi:hypothetical protein